MKQKLFTLLTLLLVGISGAWADDVIISYTVLSTDANPSSAGWTADKDASGTIGGVCAFYYKSDKGTFTTDSNNSNEPCYNLNGGDASIKLTLSGENKFKTGDKVKVTFASTGNSARACKVRTGYKSSTNELTSDNTAANTTKVTKTVELTSSFNDLGTIYIERAGSGINIFSVSVERATGYNVSAVTSTGTDTYGTVSAAASTLAEGKTTVITAVPASGYKVTNWAVSGTGASISPSGASNSLTTTLTMGTADATVTCTFGVASSYTVTHTLTNVTKTSGATSTYEYSDYTAVYAAEDGYVLPNTITVTAGGSDITANCTWNKSTGTVTIPAAYVTGNIEITVIGSVYVAPTCGILFTLDFVNTSTVTMSDGDEDLALTSTYATITGGSASMSFFNSGKTDQTVINSSKKASYGTNNQYLKLTLTHALKPGDVISFAGGSGAQIAIANTGSKTSGTGGPANQSADDKVATTSYSYTVEENDAIDGLKVLYVGRATASSTTHGKITIMRPASITPGKTYTTYVAPCALDFTGHAKLTAYIATAASASAVTMTKVNKVPENTPLVLKATETGSAISVPVAISSTDDVSANKLLASDGVSTIGGDGVYDYILSNGMFYHASAGVLPAGKCYLHLDAEPAANELTMDFGDEAGETTGVASVGKPQTTTDREFYNLAGQRVAQPTRGLYIVNGKKVLVK